MSSVRLSRRRSYQRAHKDGTQFSPQGASHNYYVEVSLSGPLHPETGLIMNIRDIDALMDQAWRETPAWPTTEILAQTLFTQLQPLVRSAGAQLCRLRVEQAPDYWVDVWP